MENGLWFASIPLLRLLGFANPPIRRPASPLVKTARRDSHRRRSPQMRIRGRFWLRVTCGYLLSNSAVRGMGSSSSVGSSRSGVSEPWGIL
jgi:hypothetical protein